MASLRNPYERNPKNYPDVSIPVNSISKGTQEQQDAAARMIARRTSGRRETQDERYTREVQVAIQNGRYFQERSLYDNGPEADAWWEENYPDEEALEEAAEWLREEPERIETINNLFEKINILFDNEISDGDKQLLVKNPLVGWPDLVNTTLPNTFRFSSMYSLFNYERSNRYLNKFKEETPRKTKHSGLKRDNAATIMFLKEEYDILLDEMKAFREWCFKRYMNIFSLVLNIAKDTHLWLRHKDFRELFVLENTVSNSIVMNSRQKRLEYIQEITNNRQAQKTFMKISDLLRFLNYFRIRGSKRLPVPDLNNFPSSIDGDIDFTLPLKDGNSPIVEKHRHEQKMDPTMAKNIEKPALEELPAKYPKRAKMRKFLMGLARINGYSSKSPAIKGIDTNNWYGSGKEFLVGSESSGERKDGVVSAGEEKTPAPVKKGVSAKKAVSVKKAVSAKKGVQNRFPPHFCVKMTEDQNQDHCFKGKNNAFLRVTIPQPGTQAQLRDYASERTDIEPVKILNWTPEAIKEYIKLYPNSIPAEWQQSEPKKESSKKAESRGICPFCNKDVLTTESRIKDTGIYYHEKCNKFKNEGWQSRESKSNPGKTMYWHKEHRPKPTWELPSPSSTTTAPSQFEKDMAARAALIKQRKSSTKSSTKPVFKLDLKKLASLKKIKKRGGRRTRRKSRKKRTKRKRKKRTRKRRKKHRKTTRKKY